MVRVALITGVTGQDGSYLAELLLMKGYTVYGVIRRHSSIQTEGLDHIFDRLNLIYGDMTDQTSLFNAFHTIVSREAKAMERLEVYNLAAQSHVNVSFDMPEYTSQADAIGVLRLLEVIQQQDDDVRAKIRFFQASTSELYGEVAETPQNETTPFKPRNPYAVAKQYGYSMVNVYRDAYGMYACNGILFNHTSPRRGEAFVERKISIGVAKLMTGKAVEPMKLGNLDTARDMGHARDYVEGMWLMLQQERGGDYVLATGDVMTVRQMVELAFSVYGKTVTWTGNGTNENGYCDDRLVVVVDPKYYRPSEMGVLRGDARKARREIGWMPRCGMEDTLRELFEYDKATHQ